MSTEPAIIPHKPADEQQECTDAPVDDCQSRLAEKNRELTRLVHQIEIAKREWEKTMDCAGDMIILTDSDGRIKRVNKAVKDFTGRPYPALLGKMWEDLIVDNGLEAMTLFAGSTELWHASTDRWFELNAYPFDDSELGFSGNVLIVHETTKVRHMTEALEDSKQKIETQRNELLSALTKVSELMERVVRNQDRQVRLSNPNLIKCYVEKNCTKEECPCYGKEAMRCWQVVGTYCNDEIQGGFARKYKNCSECDVYRAATMEPLYEIGEHFNNMMHMLIHDLK
jgi:PAS domain S-box-containing protein